MFTAKATGSTVPTGTFTFYSGATPIGTSGTLVSGVGSLTISTLATGSQSITATYSGDSNYSTTTSAPLTIVVEDFSLTISATGGGTSQTVVPGGVAVYTFTISPLAPATTFPAAVTLSASGLPSGATYSFSPASLAAGAGATTVTLTIQTPLSSIAFNLHPQVHTTVAQADLAQTGVRTAESRPQSPQRPASKLPFFALALLLLPLAGRLRRTGSKLGRMLPLVLLLLAGIAAAAGLSGCGGTAGGYFGQVPATFNILVTGNSGNLSHSTGLTLTVE